MAFRHSSAQTSGLIHANKLAAHPFLSQALRLADEIRILRTIGCSPAGRIGIFLVRCCTYHTHKEVRDYVRLYHCGRWLSRVYASQSPERRLTDECSPP